MLSNNTLGLPTWLSGKQSACKCRRCRIFGFDPWVKENPLEEEMATHYRILSWRIPWTEEPGGLQSMESQRVRHNWVTEHAGRSTYLSSSNTFYFPSVQFSSVAQSCPTLQPHEPQHVRSPCPSPTPWVCLNTCSLSFDAIQPSHSLRSPSPLAINLSQLQGIFNKSAFHIKWPKYWSFSFSISSSNEYSELISFRMDWLDLLAFPGTLKSLLQHHSVKALVL